MKKKKEEPINEHSECYGNFSIKSPICKQACALALQCSVEHEKIMRIGYLNDLIFDREDIFIKI